jgi:predicted aldo/keto reductase-like oxidoreductase
MAESIDASVEVSRSSTKNGSTECTDKAGNPWQPGAGMQYRRFGRTNLRLPVFSCGGMRFMYGADLLKSKLGGRYICSGLCTLAFLVGGIPLAVGGGMAFNALKPINLAVPWGAVSGVVGVLYYSVLVQWYTQGNQSNLQSTLEASFESGITHVETAKLYGTSEKQIGNAFAAIWKRGKYRREDIILQTKVRPTDDKQKLIAGVNDSLKKLKTDWIDLLALHGVNSEQECEQALKCADWIEEEFIRTGKVKHLGFSTHARTTQIVQAINTNKFSFVNLHK